MAELKTEQERVEEIQTKLGGWSPTVEEREIVIKVQQRYDDMKAGADRTASEEDWQAADKEYRGFIEDLDDDDERANVNKPIIFSLIETELQETMERNSRPVVKRREESDQSAEELTNEVLKYSYDVGNFDYQYYLAKKESLIKGTAVLFEFFRDDRRVVKKLDLKKDEDGNFTEVFKDEEKIDFEDVYAMYIPVEDLYLDPSANHIEKCKDCIRREILNVDEFLRIYSNKRGFKNLEFVGSGGDPTRLQESDKTPKDVSLEGEIEIIHYYNRALDEYHVLADTILIKEGPLPFPHKELPFALLYAYRDPNKLYGIGLPKVLKPLVDERNTMSNMRIDFQKFGINKMFLIDDNTEIDEIDLVPRPHGMIPINTQGRPLRDTIIPLEYGDVKPSSFREEEVLLEDIRRASGIDDRVTGVNVGGTATEAAILKESSMKRINAKARLNEMDGLVRLGKLRLENIRLFYTVPKIEKISGKDTKKYRTVRVEGKEFSINDDGRLVVDRDKDGFSFLKLDKKMSKFLDADFDISFDAAAAPPISKPIQQAKITEMVTALSNNPMFLAQIEPRKLVHRFIEVFDEDPKRWLRQDVADQEDMQLLAEMENRVMLSGQPLTPTRNPSQDHTQLHLHKTETADFEQADPAIQEIFEAHITGEAAQLSGGEASPEASQTPAPTENPVDVTPNFGGQS